jgi:peptide/nickel transport system substrate-binding protein
MIRILLAALGATTALSGAAHALEMKIGAANMAPYLDPGRDHSNVGSQFYYNTFDVLIEKDYSSEKSIFKPGLALSWELVEPTVMEFKLRQGVTFHNGESMTADDVVFSYNRMFQSDFPPYQVRYRDRLSNFEKAEKIDDYTVRVHVKRPEPLWETLINMQQLMIVPEDYIKGLTGDPNVAEHSDFEAFAQAPIGTGPYRIASFTASDELIWERFDSFWGEPAPFERITVKQIAETASRITALKNGEVDLVTNIAPDQLSIIEADPNLKAEGMVTPLFHVLIFNTQNPRTADPKLRRAMTLAVDRDTLNEALWLGMAVVPSTHTYPQYGPLYMPELKTFYHDLEEAKKLLAESSYKGEELRFDSFSTYYTNGLLAAQAVQEMWTDLGINVKLNVIDKWTGADPEMNIRNWSNPMYFADPFGSFGVMWAPGGPSETEGRFKTDAEYAEIWERFRFSDSIEARRKAYAELMERIKNDPPFLILYQPYESWAMRKTINWAPKPGHIPYVLDFRAGSIDMAAN